MTTNLINLVNKATAELNKQYLSNMKTWIVDTALALAKFKEENKELRKSNQAVFYNDLFEIAGGKTWYNLIDGRNTEMRLEVVEKHCQQVIEKRNHTITKKLKDLNITEVETVTTDYQQTGFEGIFKVQTDKGIKTVEIKVIVAGGYNVQCIHNRTLVKVR